MKDSPMYIPEVPTIAGPSREQASHGRARRFETREERFTRRHNSPALYFRLHDSLCRSYLELAASPREFEGLKLLFPFVREKSVLGAGRGRGYLAV
jgi:hypothetical protein